MVDFDLLSFPWKRESRLSITWTPAFAGATVPATP
jgi:hypothetical protein